MDDVTVRVSLWLPIGRPNFYSATANGWMRDPDVTGGGTVPFASRMIDDKAYVPRLSVSVLRRLVEVAPVSFGYERTGRGELNDEVEDLTRPIAVTLTLKPTTLVATLDQRAPERLANFELVQAGVHTVMLRVDEHGAYTFTATAPAGRQEQVRTALMTHVGEVFGGSYSLDRRSTAFRQGIDNGGSAALRRYQGVDPSTPAAPGQPRGILTFFQLNTLVEGLFNESLSPAVFFEQNEFLQQYLASGLPGSLTMIEDLSQVFKLIAVENIDAASPAGLIIALRRFLDVTAREVLQKLKWSVESVRRALLDESVGMLHRQSKLIQLNIGALVDEQAPEQAEGASESQLRGYVMLAAAKLPLVGNVYEIATLAKDHLRDVAGLAGPRPAHGRPVGDDLAGTAIAAELPDAVRKLEIQLNHWLMLLRGLRTNVTGLESAIEHSWRESLLYEQQQVRREQEGMAEIERSRAGRPTSERAGKNVYNFLMLVFAAAAVLLTVKTGNILDISKPGRGWAATAVALWPIALVAVTFYLIVPLAGTVRRIYRDRRGQSDSYPYEFAFRLEEAADSAMVCAYLDAKKGRRHPRSTLRRLTVTNRGGGRIERVSDDRALVKMHSTATFKVGLAKYARFEVVNEILAHRVSGKPTHAIVQCRIFGDSPKPLRPAAVYELVRVILNDVGINLTTADPATGDEAGIKVDQVLELVRPLYLRPAATAAPPRRLVR